MSLNLVYHSLSREILECSGKKPVSQVYQVYQVYQTSLSRSGSLFQEFQVFQVFQEFQVYTLSLSRSGSLFQVYQCFSRGCELFHS